MRLIFQIAAGAVLIIAAIFVLSAVKSENIKKGTHKYYFFPLANVYYDSVQKEFIQYDSSLKSWKAIDALPVQKELGRSVFIENPSTPVWLDNNIHRMTYSIKLYAKKVDVTPPPPKPKVVKTDTLQQDDRDTQTKKRKSFREFLKRIWKGPEDKTDSQNSN